MRDFFIELENKMAVLLNAKEQTNLVPFSQRILLCHLFLKMRQYTSSARKYVNPVVRRTILTVPYRILGRFGSQLWSTGLVSVR